jgi:hypothetical protein
MVRGMLHLCGRLQLCMHVVERTRRWSHPFGAGLHWHQFRLVNVRVPLGKHVMVIGDTPILICPRQSEVICAQLLQSQVPLVAFTMGEVLTQEVECLWRRLTQTREAQKTTVFHGVKMWACWVLWVSPVYGQFRLDFCIGHHFGGDLRLLNGSV